MFNTKKTTCNHPFSHAFAMLFTRSAMAIIGTMFFIAVVQGCSTLGKLDASKDILVGTIQVDALYDLAKQRYMGLELDDAEREVATESFEVIDGVRDYIKRIDDTNTAIMSVALSRTMVDQIDAAYSGLSDTYLTYAKRIGIDPEDAFVGVHTISRGLIDDVRDTLDELDNGEDRVNRVGSLVSLVLQSATLIAGF